MKPTGTRRPHVIVWDTLLDYHLAGVNAFADAVNDPVAVLCIAKQREYWPGETKVQPKCPVSVLFQHRLEQLSSARVCAALWRWLGRVSPGSITVGYGRFHWIVAALWGRLHGVPVVLKSDTIHAKKRRRRCVETVKSCVLQLYQTALVPGRLQRQYLESLGFPGSRIADGLYVVDFDGWQAKAAAIRQGSTASSGELPVARPYFLFVGRLVWEKNLGLLLQAYRSYVRNAGYPWPLVIVGTGPLEQEIRGLSTGLAVHFVGHKNLDALALYYAFAGALLLPSVSESWGQVVLEAMACGVPAIVSSACGCAFTVVEHGVNGFIVSPHDRLAWAETLRAFTEGGIDRRAMALEAEKTAAEYRPVRFAKGLAECILKGQLALQAKRVK